MFTDRALVLACALFIQVLCDCAVVDVDTVDADAYLGRPRQIESSRAHNPVIMLGLIKP